MKWMLEIMRILLLLVGERVRWFFFLIYVSKRIYMNVYYILVIIINLFFYLIFFLIFEINNSIFILYKRKWGLKYYEICFLDVIVREWVVKIFVYFILNVGVVFCFFFLGW